MLLRHFMDILLLLLQTCLIHDVVAVPRYIYALKKLVEMLLRHVVAVARFYALKS